MRLATLNNRQPDGRLVVVARDQRRAAIANHIAPTMQAAIEHWSEAAPRLRALAEALEQRDAPDVVAFDPAEVLAPLPRAWQWLDGSAYPSHGALMQKAFGLPPIETDRPLMYQGMSDRFLAPCQDVPLPSEADGIDFEGEFGVIVGAVPMGCPADDALDHIRLLVQINDWSLRAIAPVEMKTGFGWVQAKPPCAMAPFAITPDELGANWRNGRVCLNLNVAWNGAHFGSANGEPMGHGFHELVAHAARTRDLVAGTVIGSGTVSNANFREVGSSCIAERRGIEVIDQGEPKTNFMKFGDTVHMEAVDAEGRAPFGKIAQEVVRG